MIPVEVTASDFRLSEQLLSKDTNSSNIYIER